ncbi:hypothetical protein NKI41_13535 [Mesorhizobium sp. M0601]|uniref:hypothetical protein n=1 Tax=Mesorhizobium sp. M0601 TaxID=2956969 RepID=UPI0033353BE7
MINVIDQFRDGRSVRELIEASINRVNAELAESGYSASLYPPVTLLDVATTLIHGRGSPDADEVIGDVNAAVVQAMKIGDPWPELTRETVILLIGKRKNKADTLGFYNIQWHHGHNEPFVAGMPLTYSDGEPLPPLTLAEKLLATRHREWLTAGGSRRRSPKLTAFPPKPVDGGRSNAAS